MREVRQGVWHWEAPHPEWGPGDSSLEWDRQEVSSYAIDDGDRLLLFDPLAVPSEIEELAAGRDTAIVLTCPWHERDARSLVERLDAAVFVPQPEEGDPIAIDGTTGAVRGAAIEAAARASPEVVKHAAGAPIRRVIIVPGKLVNVVV